MDPATLDVLTSRVRRLEANVAQLQDAVQVYGPPERRPLFSVKVPRTPTLSTAQTTLAIYGLVFLGVGVYSLAKMRGAQR